MCGVIGFTGTLKQEPLELLNLLIYESRIRGMHAYGAAIAQRGALISYNKQFSLEQIIAFIAKFKGREINLIAHTRYSTSGNWSDHDNNQPVVTEPGIALVFNGIVTQLKKAAWESAYSVRCETENDGELITKMLAAGVSVPDAIEQTGATFAGLWLTPDGLYAYRNLKRPLYRSVHESGTFYASTADIFKRAWVKFEPEPLKPKQLYYHP